MCALAGLPARAAAQVRALEAGAPALAAAATCPLRLLDIVRPSAMGLLMPLVGPDVLQPLMLPHGLTLREARYVYRDTGSAIATLASIVRRIVWRDMLDAREPAADRSEQWLAATFVLQALCILLMCPFQVMEEPDSATALHEAAAR